MASRSTRACDAVRQTRRLQWQRPHRVDRASAILKDVRRRVGRAIRSSGRHGARARRARRAGMRARSCRVATRVGDREPSGARRWPTTASRRPRSAPPVGGREGTGSRQSGSASDPSIDERPGRRQPQRIEPTVVVADSSSGDREPGTTAFGGLLFLLHLVRALDLPASSATATRGSPTRSLRWTLHQLALLLAPVDANDAAALAFAGLPPASRAPSARRAAARATKKRSPCDEVRDSDRGCAARADARDGRRGRRGRCWLASRRVAPRRSPIRRGSSFDFRRRRRQHRRAPRRTGPRSRLAALAGRRREVRLCLRRRGRRSSPRRPFDDPLVDAEHLAHEVGIMAGRLAQLLGDAPIAREIRWRPASRFCDRSLPAASPTGRVASAPRIRSSGWPTAYALAPRRGRSRCCSPAWRRSTRASPASSALCIHAAEPRPTAGLAAQLLCDSPRERLLLREAAHDRCRRAEWRALARRRWAFLRTLAAARRLAVAGAGGHQTCGPHGCVRSRSTRVASVSRTGSPGDQTSGARRRRFAAMRPRSSSSWQTMGSRRCIAPWRSRQHANVPAVAVEYTADASGEETRAARRAARGRARRWCRLFA